MIMRYEVNIVHHLQSPTKARAKMYKILRKLFFLPHQDKYFRLSLLRKMYGAVAVNEKCLM